MQELILIGVMAVNDTDILQQEVITLARACYNQMKGKRGIVRWGIKVQFICKTQKSRLGFLV